MVLGIVVFLVSKNLKRTILVVSGWGLYESFNIFYDYILWGYIQYKYEILGSIALSLGALIINFFLLHWYTKKGIDWLGVNILEDIKKNGHKWVDKVLANKNKLMIIPVFLPVKLFSLLLSALNKNDVLAFLFLSIWQDPFIAVAFLRHGRVGPVTKKDYYVLLASTVVTSLYWSVLIEIILRIIQAIF